MDIVLQRGGGLWLCGTNTSDAEASFIDLYFTISSGAVSARVCDGRGDFYFQIVNFPFLDNDVPHSASSGVCVISLSKLLRHLTVTVISMLAVCC